MVARRIYLSRLRGLPVEIDAHAAQAECEYDGDPDHGNSTPQIPATHCFINIKGDPFVFDFLQRMIHPEAPLWGAHTAQSVLGPQQDVRKCGREMFERCGAC